MKPNYLPAVGVTFRPQDGDPKKLPVTLYRPYAAIPQEELITSAEERGDAGAMLELGERFWFGTLGAEQDYEEAIRWLLRAAERGVQDAEYLIAEAYRCGYGVEQDYEKYFDWLDRSAQHGSWLAGFAMSAAYRQGKDAFEGSGPDADPEQCFAWSLQTEKALRAYWTFYTRPGFCDFNEILSRLLHAYTLISLQLSKHFSEGVGTKQDYKEALYWLRKGRRFVMNSTGDTDIQLFDDEIAALQEKMGSET